jgi:hypothetical protein
MNKRGILYMGVIYENRDLDDPDFEDEYELNDSDYEIKNNGECYWSEISYHRWSN